jgi:hypothetical protein
VDTTSLVLIGAAGLALAGTSAALLFRRSPDAAAREQRRLQRLLESGRLTLGHLDEVRGALVFYSYEVGGATYTAAQDLVYFPQLNLEEFRSLSGPVNIRYDRANPPNSMVHCSSWSGLGLKAQPTPDYDSSLRRLPQ